MLSNIFMFLADATNTPSAQFCQDASSVFRLIGWVIVVLQIAIPIIIVVLGMIDLGKAVMAGEEKEIKEAQKMLIKRVIYGVLVFFVVTIVKTVFNLAAGKNFETGICWTCATDPGSNDCTNAVAESTK